MLLVHGVLALAVTLAAVRRAWADHGVGLRGSMNPWLETVLWGVLGLAVAMTVALIVIVFTRAPADREKGARRLR